MTDYYWIHFSGYGVSELLAGLKLYGSIFSVGALYEFKKMMESMTSAIATVDFTTEPFLASCIYIYSINFIVAVNYSQRVAEFNK